MPSSVSTVSQSHCLPVASFLHGTVEKKVHLCHRGGQRDCLRHLQSAQHEAVNNRWWLTKEENLKTGGHQGLLRGRWRALSWVGVQVKRPHAWHLCKWIYGLKVGNDIVQVDEVPIMCLSAILNTSKSPEEDFHFKNSAAFVFHILILVESLFSKPAGTWG